MSNLLIFTVFYLYPFLIYERHAMMIDYILHFKHLSFSLFSLFCRQRFAEHTSERSGSANFALHDEYSEKDVTVKMIEILNNSKSKITHRRRCILTNHRGFLQLHEEEYQTYILSSYGCNIPVSITTTCFLLDCHLLGFLKASTNRRQNVSIYR